MCHDVQYEAVSLIHAAAADGREVTDALIDIILDDALCGGDIFMLYGKHGTHHRGAHTRSEFQGTRRLGTVADHSREVRYHVLDGIADLLEASPHQVGDAAAAARACHHTATQGTERSQCLLDIDGGEITDDQGTDELLFSVVVLLGEHHHRHGGADALVSATAVAHHGNHRPCHTGITGTAGDTEHLREDAVAHDTAPQGRAHRLT